MLDSYLVNKFDKEIVKRFSNISVTRTMCITGDDLLWSLAERRGWDIDKLILSMTDDEIESVMQNEILRALFECERVQKEIEHTIVMMDDDIDFYKKEYVRGC